MVGDIFTRYQSRGGWEFGKVSKETKSQITLSRIGGPIAGTTVQISARTYAEVLNKKRVWEPYTGTADEMNAILAEQEQAANERRLAQEAKEEARQVRIAEIILALSDPTNVDTTVELYRTTLDVRDKRYVFIVQWEETREYTEWNSDGELAAIRRNIYRVTAYSRDQEGTRRCEGTSGGVVADSVEEAVAGYVEAFIR